MATLHAKDIRVICKAKMKLLNSLYDDTAVIGKVVCNASHEVIFNRNSVDMVVARCDDEAMAYSIMYGLLLPLNDSDADTTEEGSAIECANINYIYDMIRKLSSK